jgi:hypothetical protein
MTVKRRRAEGKKGGVLVVVFMSAFMVSKGLTLTTMLRGKPLPWMEFDVGFPTSPSKQNEAYRHSIQRQMLVINPTQGEMCCADPTLMPQIIFNDLPAAEVEQYCKQF